MRQPHQRAVPLPLQPTVRYFQNPNAESIPSPRRCADGTVDLLPSVEGAPRFSPRQMGHSIKEKLGSLPTPRRCACPRVSMCVDVCLYVCQAIA